jgi:large subunit ribosomal protein L18
MKTLRKRRKQFKTDYGKRIKLLKSNSPRLVFRKSNKYVVAQYVVSKEAKDKIIFGESSKKLMNFGWPEEFKNSLKSIPAAYLLGFLAGNKMQKDKLEKPILDFGMSRMIHKSKVYAFLKGVIDAGIEVKYKKDIFPEEDRLKGKSLKSDFTSHFEKIKSNIEKA